MDKRYGDYITTYTGKKAYPLDFRSGDFDLNDVAHALSNMCRFNGHVRNFYSVAEHSVLVAKEVLRRTRDPYSALAGLLHDAAEAYLVDIPRPVKRSDEFAAYRQFETTMTETILLDHNIPKMPQVVHKVDNEIVQIEADFLMHGTKEWAVTVRVDPDFQPTIRNLSPWSAESNFKALYAELR